MLDPLIPGDPLFVYVQCILATAPVVVKCYKNNNE